MRRQQPSFMDLVSVVSIGQSQTHDQTTITLLAAEVYADGVMLSSWVNHPEIYLGDRTPDPRRGRSVYSPHLPMIVTDESGTVYDGHAFGSSTGQHTPGEPWRWRVYGTITPAFAAGVGKIHIEIPEVQLVAMGAINTPPYYVVGDTFPGPWTFAFAIPSGPDGA